MIDGPRIVATSTKPSTKLTWQASISLQPVTTQHRGKCLQISTSIADHHQKLATPRTAKSVAIPCRLIELPGHATSQQKLRGLHSSPIAGPSFEPPSAPPPFPPPSSQRSRRSASGVSHAYVLPSLFLYRKRDTTRILAAARRTFRNKFDLYLIALTGRNNGIPSPDFRFDINSVL